MNIDVTDQQTRFDIDGEALSRCAAGVMERVSALDGSFRWTELSLVLTDDRIRELNRQWFGRDSVTDVVSFAYAAGPSGGGDTGEVVLNVQQAFEEGREREGPDRELALYLAHGCHHLMGADDATPEDKEHMLTLETSWVREARNTGCCGPFFK